MRTAPPVMIAVGIFAPCLAYGILETFNFKFLIKST